MFKFTLRINSTIISILGTIVFSIVFILLFLQYKSSNEFALLTTKKVFKSITNKVINQIELYDSQSIRFIKIIQAINKSDELPILNKRHTLLPVITKYISTTNYIYAIYTGYQNDSFYIVYNLDLSEQMRQAQNAPHNAKWLIKKIIKELDGTYTSHKEFVDSNFITLSTLSEKTTYKPTLRPWYKEAINSKKIIKTKPYIFSSIQEPGVTYAQHTVSKNGTVVSLDITLNSLSKLLEKQNLVEGSAAFIFKANGKVIGQSNHILNKNIDNLNDEYKDIFIQNGKIIDLEKQQVVKINGIDYFKYTTQIKSEFKSKDYLVILSPIDVIMKPYKEKVIDSLTVVILILLFIVAPIIYYIVRLITRPIVQLQNENKKIANGQFQDLKKVDSFISEISSLSNSLISMADTIEESQLTLEHKVEVRTSLLALEKENVEQILANILLPVLITSKEKRVIVYANRFAQELYEMSADDIINCSLDDLYTLTNGPDAIIAQLTTKGKVDALEEHITTHTGKEFIGLLSVTPISYNNEECYIGMTVDITRQKDMENEVRAIHKHTRESIEYASLIQGSLLPDEKLLVNYFQDNFVYWMPKDTVGGDIWLFNDLRHEDECLLFFIDCTGHGVPGAFVTMIVKAIEREIITKITDDSELEISPAWIMSYFNKTMKILLKQETKDAKSNAGWDGGIIYYNKKDMILKFAGAETPLFYMTTDGDFKTIKGNRYSVGYKKCDSDYKYKETIIEVEKGMKFYCTTDGYLDQNGGEKDFPFGKKRFGNIIKEHHTESMKDQKEYFIQEMAKYESQIENNDRNDDMTVIAFEI